MKFEEAILVELVEVMMVGITDKVEAKEDKANYEDQMKMLFPMDEKQLIVFFESMQNLIFRSYFVS